ncbi:hypothetical protein AVEN_109672-1 [Araneus ventricosus]|uniref:Uncharacterized protein n=1 Tax=Araneus ventricosus TaxID=182803 RepID=A0A4Y2H225_ARAVE|nr:hypothetical protein AVEN_21557-1 [Araneus ventricosus]GBM60120.1 hypothetical protein AVEN_109672-1 [Araneus ventricosus]
MIPCRSNISECDWFMTTGERQLQFQSRYHMGRSLTLPLCLLVLAGNNGVTFTPWVALPGECTSDVHHPLLPGTPPCRVEATNRSKGESYTLQYLAHSMFKDLFLLQKQCECIPQALFHKFSVLVIAVHTRGEGRASSFALKKGRRFTYLWYK